MGRAFAQTAAYFEDAVRRGQASGTISPKLDPAPVARGLLALLLGLQVLVRSGAGREQLEAVVAQAGILVAPPERKPERKKGRGTA